MFWSWCYIVVVQIMICMMTMAGRRALGFSMVRQLSRNNRNGVRTSCNVDGKMNEKQKTSSFFHQNKWSGGCLYHGSSSEEEDTIFALSTGPIMYSATGISVIRLSGSKSHEVLKTLLGDNQSLPPLRKACVRYLYSNTDDDSTMMDQAMVLRFQGPSSFTGEDMVELHCHGSRAVTTTVLETLSKLIRPAERGEFTQRAYSAGKLNLLQVEALADLLASDTKTQAQLALKQYNGNLYTLYTNWQTKLTKALAHTEAVLDFGEEDLDDADAWTDDLLHMLSVLKRDMEQHLNCRVGELIRDGLRVAIVGPPNAGKSSLLNCLGQEDVAIVSPIAGTTRDVVSLDLELQGIRVTLYDTAGLRSSTTDVIEEQGIQRTQQITQQAQIILCLQDITTSENGDNNEDWQSMISPNLPTTQQQHKNNVFMIYNKADLNSSTEIKEKTLPNFIDTDENVFEISCQTQQGIPELIQRLTYVVQQSIQNSSGDNNDGGEEVVLTRQRHRIHVENALESLNKFFQLSVDGITCMDLAAEELRCANTHLGRILGATDVEEVLDVLFADFCIGK